MGPPKLRVLAKNPELARIGQRVQSLVGEDLQRVEATIATHLRSPYAPVAEMGAYLAASRGKRLRPILVLLCSRLIGYEGQKHILYAAVLEFIHTATLIHDDIVDQALLRRGRASLTSRWGPELAVLMGDRVFINAMHLAVKDGWNDVIPVISDTTLSLIEGELIQSHRKWDLTLQPEDNLEIVKRKTAHLFSTCCSTPAYLSGAPQDVRESLAAFGLNLGIAFQMVDDCLDFISDEATLGKPAGHDLKEGKITLPLLLLLERGTPDDKAFLEAVVAARRFDPETLREVAARVVESGMLEEAQRIASSYADEARAHLRGFPESPYREVLALMPEYIIRRHF
ncbi:MAG: polyprenyl synthetase family protein [Acidobacteriota bacterium]